jgi:hypothetical protein
MPTWEITLQVYGPVTVRNNFNFQQRKDFHYPDPLYSNIEIRRNGKYGVTIDVITYAENQNLAKKAALYFCGQALDVLSLSIDLPLFLTLIDTNNFHPRIENQRRITEEEEWINAFRNARLWLLTEPTFLRSLGWYRKGLYTEDVFDKFLALYNSIETLCSKYYPNPENCLNRGSKCHIWETFKSLWGDCENWPIIPNERDWIDHNYDTRVSIAHGVASIEINVVEKVFEKISVIQSVAHRLLIDWRDNALQPIITEEIQRKLF